MKQKLIVLLACILLCGRLSAHRELESLTTLTWNPRSEVVEVIHQIHQHDAQEVLNNLPGLDKETRDLGSVSGRAHIALEVEKAFSINEGGKQTDIQLVGATLDADFILVFQEFAFEDQEEITMRFTLFKNIFEDYISRVTVLLSGLNRTVFFNRQNITHTIDFSVKSMSK
jgi:hypothetical protein